MMPARISIKGEFIWYNIWIQHEFDRVYSRQVKKYWRQLFFEDLERANLTVEDLKQFYIIVNPNWEGHNADDVEPFRLMLSELGFPMYQFGVLFTCYEDTDSLPYPAECNVHRLIYNAHWHLILRKQNIPWRDLKMDRRLVVLMRRASESRCTLAKKILDTFNSEDVRITLGTFPDMIPTEWREMVSPYTYPMYVEDDRASNTDQHAPQHNLFYTAPVQLVVETSNETDRLSWRSIFITEKSYKVFAWHQFPIWYAVPGTVEKIREQGFDLFEDLIDHSYDAIDDPEIRMDRVVAEAYQFCKHDGIKLRKRHWDRLEYNAQLVEYISKTAFTVQKTKAEKIQNELLELYKSRTSIPTQ
jgi:hypothetical protein